MIEHRPVDYTPIPGDYVTLRFAESPYHIQGAFLGIDPSGEVVHLAIWPEDTGTYDTYGASAYFRPTCITHVQDQDVFPHTLRDFLAPLREQLERDES